jgi:hypothetical protein
VNAVCASEIEYEHAEQRIRTGAVESEEVAQAEDDYADPVRPLRALRPVAERAEEDDEEESDVKAKERLKNLLASAGSNETKRIVARARRRLDQLSSSLGYTHPQHAQRRTKKKAR